MAASWRFRLPPPLPCLLLGCLAVVPSASAQVLVYSSGNAPAVHGRIDLRTGADTPLPSSGLGTYTSDGQYGMRQEGNLLRLWHVPTGAATTLPTDFSPWMAHPRTVAMFGVSGGLPARLDATGVHVWPVCAPAPPNTAFAMDLAGDGATLVVACGADLVSVDATTGAELRRLANANVTGTFALSQDGTEVTAWRPGATSAELVRLRLTDGQVLATRAVTTIGTPAGIIPAPGRDRAVAMSCRLVSVNVVCAAELIEVSGLTDVLALGESYMVRPSVTLSPDGRDAFVGGLGYAASSSFGAWIDVPTGAVRATISRTTAEGGFAMAYLAAPLPPALSAPAVAGGTVSLTWTMSDRSPQVTGYRLEAGVAPGTTAVSFDLGPAPGATIPGVPPGRYYARLRAVNYNGVSALSNEIVIDVP